MTPPRVRPLTPPSRPQPQPRCPEPPKPAGRECPALDLLRGDSLCSDSLHSDSDKRDPLPGEQP